MIAYENLAFTSYSHFQTKITIPSEFKNYFNKHRHISFTAPEDLKYNKKLLTLNNSLAINNIEIFFERDCNLNCSYCCYKAMSSSLPDSMDKVPIYYSHEKLKTLLKEYKFERLMFAGGEPTLFPDLIIEMDALAEAMKVPPYFHFRLFTNGTLPEKMDYILKNTKRVSFGISLHMDSYKEEYLAKWEALGQKYNLNNPFFDRVTLQHILIPEMHKSKPTIIKSNLKTSYSIVRPMHKEVRNWSLEDIDYLCENHSDIASSLFNQNNFRFILGNFRGCLSEMIYEHWQEDLSKIQLSNCLSDDKKRLGTIHDKNKMASLAKLRDQTYNQITNRKLLVSHCGFHGDNETYEQNYLQDAFLNTLCLKLHIKNNRLKHALALQKYANNIFQKSLATEIPSQKVPVAVEINYDFLKNHLINLNVRSLFSIVKTAGYSVSNITSDMSLKNFDWNIANDCWFDADGETLFVSTYPNLNRYRDTDLLAIKCSFTDDFASAWLIGKKANIMQVIEGKASGYTETNAKYFAYLKEKGGRNALL